MRRGDVVRLKPTPEDYRIWEWDRWIVSTYGMGPFLYHKAHRYHYSPGKHCVLATMEGEVITSRDGKAAPFEICDLIHDPYLTAVRKQRLRVKAR